MKEYACKDIIKSVNNDRKNLKKIVLIDVLTIIAASKDKITNETFKGEVLGVANRSGAINQYWINDNELPEITYNPKEDTTYPTTGPDRKKTILSNPNPEYSDGQKAIGPSKTMLALPPHTKVLSKKDKEDFNNMLYKVKENTGLCFNEFAEIAKKYMDNEKLLKNELEKEIQKSTINPENKRLKQHRIDFAKNIIQSITTIFSNFTLNIPLGGKASQIIIQKISAISQDEESKKFGEKLSYKFMEFTFYSSLLYLLTKNKDSGAMLEGINANKSKLINYIRFFDDHKSMNRADEIFSTIMDILNRAR